MDKEVEKIGQGEGLKTIIVTAEIHPDGAVYVKDNEGTFHYVGCIGESTFSRVPDEKYEEVKNITNK